ncbi:hypothetical protein M569_05129, partial [Genlisea aurea]
GGNFLYRVISYLTNEVIVNGLANNPRFQLFAVRTSKKIEELSEIALQKKKELTEQLKDASRKL